MKVSNTSLKRFEDWEDVDCNQCARYWDDSCDGVSKGSKKPCNSFIATRSVVIPERIERLEKAVKWLIGALALTWWVILVLGMVF